MKTLIIILILMLAVSASAEPLSAISLQLWSKLGKCGKEDFIKALKEIYKERKTGCKEVEIMGSYTEELILFFAKCKKQEV